MEESLQWSSSWVYNAGVLLSPLSWAMRLVAIFVCLFSASTAFGYTYTDDWVDDSDPNNIRLVGFGSTYDPSNGYMGTPQGYQQIHYYWVRVTITSPSGRTATMTSPWGSSQVSTDASLPLLAGEEYETGNYLTQTQHWNCCPYMQPNPWDGTKCYPSTNTSTTTLIALRDSGWRVIGDTPSTCVLQATCSGTCVTIGDQHVLAKVPLGTSCSAQGIYYQVKELYINQVCYPTTRWGTGRVFPGVCD
jgi:hypothetical protein